MNEGGSPRSWVQVLNYRGRDCIGDCLRSLKQIQDPPGGWRGVVVDNASDDDSAELVAERFPEFHLIRNDQNLGFAAGNNVGLRTALESGFEYAILVNMDLRGESDWIRRLVKEADAHPQAALLGAHILTEDGESVEFDGCQFDPVTTSGGYAEHPVGGPDTAVRNAAYACGAAMLLRLEIVREVGLFEDSFFAYHEDVELALRCRMHGYGVLNVRNALVYHSRGGAGAGRDFRDFLGTRNLTLTLGKLYDRSSWLQHGPALVSLLLGDRDRIPAVLAAAFDLPAVLHHRRRRAAVGVRSYAEVARELERLDR